MKLWREPGAEDRAESVAVVDVVVIEIRAGVVASDPGVVVVVLLGKPNPFTLLISLKFNFCQSKI